MKKLPTAFRFPMTALSMLSYMISSLPLLLVYSHAPEGVDIISIYQDTMKDIFVNVIPYALMLAIPGIICINFVVTRFVVKKPLNTHNI